MKTIEQLAMEAGVIPALVGSKNAGFFQHIERFTALVREDYRDELLANAGGPDTHCWDDDTQQDCWSWSKDALAAAVLRERERCAKVCESRYMGDNNREDMEARRCAAAIRAGETK